MNPLRSAAFLRAYRFLPHQGINQGFARLMRAERPAPLVQAAIRAWVRGAGIDLSDYEDVPYRSLEDFFLRRLRPGRRPLGPGLVSPADGVLLAQGRLTPGAPIEVKGQRLSLQRLVNGAGLHALPLADYEGGSYAVIFLTPHGYHYIHMPAAGWVRGCQHLPGRFFPQNEDALRHIPDAIYEHNERAVLRLALDQGGEALLVLVGASLVGGIELRGLSRAAWARAEALACALRRERGEELGHFRFGSTVVVLLPRGAGPVLARAEGPIRMGETLAALTD